MKTNYMPAGSRTATPYLVVKDAARALTFYQQAFGATEVMRLAGPDGKVVHAEIRIGDSNLMLADEFPDWGALSPKTIGGTPVSIMLYFEDCDMVFNRAIAAGAAVLHPVQDQFYGDRSGTLIDPFGHKWTIATHQEDLPEDELRRRFEAACAKA